MNFGVFIRKRREQLGLSLRKLSTVSHISRTYLNNIESGKNTPSSKIIRSLSKHLRLNSDDLHRKCQVIPNDVKELIFKTPGSLTEIRELFKERETQ